MWYEQAGLRHRKIPSFVVPLFLIFVHLFLDCGSGGNTYVALGSPHSFESVSDLEVVALAELNFSSEAVAAIDAVYEKYDGLMQDQSDRERLLQLVVSRDAEVCATVLQLMPTTSLLDRGIPMCVCRKSMTDPDEALFDDE